MREFKAGDIVRHFKRETVDQASDRYLYEIVGIAIHTETKEQFMVYKALYNYDNVKMFDIFIRPIEMFMSEVNHNKYPDIKQKYRFEHLTSK